jgi:large subunit ribosomal protein L3
MTIMRLSKDGLMKFLLGRKIGMTRVYDVQGAIQPVTVVSAGPCTVTQLKSITKDGYTAIQVAYGAIKHPTKPLVGHLAKANTATAALIREVPLATDEDLSGYQLGQTLDVTVFTAGDTVSVAGTTKGKGFQGVVKRHGFAGGPASHGSDFHRAAGAIGGRWPQRVVKGRRMAGQMGNVRATIKGLKVIYVNPDQNVLAISGALPGPNRGLLEIQG